MATKDNQVDKDQAQINVFHKDFLDRMNSGDVEGALKDMDQAVAILKRDPKAHP